MPERSTFRNHDPPRGPPRACRPGGLARGRDGQRVPPGLPYASVGLSLRSALAPAPGRWWSSRRAHGRTAGGSRTAGRSARIVVLEFPVVLGEAEELDIATTWPHPGPRLSLCGQVCGALGAAPRRLGAPTPGLLSFCSRRCPPASLRTASMASFLAFVGPWSPAIMMKTGPRHAGGDTLGGFPNLPAVWLRRAKLGYANAIDGNPGRVSKPSRAMAEARGSRPQVARGRAGGVGPEVPTESVSKARLRQRD
jgi:hypothetical protein